MFKILLGAVAILALQVTFFDASTRIMVTVHNVVSDVKIVYDASKQIIKEQDAITKVTQVIKETSDSVKVSRSDK